MAVSTVRAAMNVRSNAYHIGGLLKDVIYSDSIASLDKLYDVFDTLAKITNGELVELPEGKDTEALIELLHKLRTHSGVLFDAQKKHVTSKINFEQAFSEIWQELDQLNDALVSSSASLKKETALSLNNGADLVRHWQYGQMILAVAAIVLALLAGIFLYASINAPIQRIIKGLKLSGGQIASASNQLFVAIHEFAKGSSRQAASLEETSSSLEEMSSMISEIASASGEQTRGIELLNQAVTEIENVTQQNAANAKQSESNSEELNTQADQMKRVVDELIALVHSNGGAKQQFGKTEKPFKRLGTPVTTKAIPDKKTSA